MILAITIILVALVLTFSIFLYLLLRAIDEDPMDSESLDSKDQSEPSISVVAHKLQEE